MMRAWLIVLMVCVGSSAQAGHHQEEKVDTFDVRSNRLEIVMDIDVGTLKVIPSEHASALRIRTRYNPDKYTYHVHYDQDRDTIYIDLDKESWNHSNSKKHHTNNSIIVELPSRPRLDIDIDLLAGELHSELGELSMERFQIESMAGETIVSFSEPNRIEMKDFTVHTFVGETQINGLGNARSRDICINSGIGELHVDFGGEYNCRCDACIDLDIGETVVTLPKNIDTKVRYKKLWLLSTVQISPSFTKNGGWYYSNDYDKDSPAPLTLEIESGIGALNISRY